MLELKPQSVSSNPHSHLPTLADLIIEQLELLGVEYVFGVPGGSIEPLYNALARSARRGGILPVVARHEAGAAFMAEGYARETGKLGVCCATTGPGATNMITGVASAFVENVPMLVVTAQTALPNFGKRVLQESSCVAVDTVGMFKSCTRYSSLVSHRGQLEAKLLSAVVAAMEVPGGPAHLSIPMDVLASPRRMRPEEMPLRLDRLMQPRVLIDAEGIEKIRGEIRQARKMVLLLGDGCGEAIGSILAFAEAFEARIVTGPSGKRWISHFHPLYAGVLGFGGHQSALNALLDPEVDLVLAVGTRLGEMVFAGQERNTTLHEKLVHIDNSPRNFSRSHMARLHVCGTLSHIFDSLLHPFGAELEMSLRSRGRQRVSVSEAGVYPPENLSVIDEHKCRSDAGVIKPQRLMKELAQRLPVQTRFVVDAGNSWAWATHYLHLQSQGLYRVGMGYGSMGWGIGAAVGTAFGAQGAPVVCLTGDGSFLMSGQEITVAVAECLPVIFVVLNDQALGMVKHGQRLGGAEPVGFELPPVDFAAMARAMGAWAETLTMVEDLVSLDYTAISARPGPTLLDVRIDPEEIPPMGARMSMLGR